MSQYGDESDPAGSEDQIPWWRPAAPYPGSDRGQTQSGPVRGWTELLGQPRQSDPGESDPGQHASVSGSQRGSARRRPAGVILLAALVALVVGGIAGFLGGRAGTRQTGAPDPAVAVSSASPTPSGHPSSPTPSPTASPTQHSATPTARDSAAVRIARSVMPSTVTIHAGSGSSGDIGSGFAIDDHGRVMTNDHVIADSANSGKIRVELNNGRRAGAKVLGRSASYDLAVLQVDHHRGLRGVSYGNSHRIKVGESVLAIGSPLGLSGTVTEGIVSAMNRSVAVGTDNSAEQKQAYLNAVQTDAAINPGNSGGPLVNRNGKVVGVNSAILTGNRHESSEHTGGNIGLGFAIPIDQARQIGKMLIKDGYATYPVINAKVTDAPSSEGARIVSDASQGAARDAGLRAGDIISAIDGKRVAGTKDLIVRIRSHRPGDTVTVTYLRDGKHHKAKVRLGSERG